MAQPEFEVSSKVMKSKSRDAAKTKIKGVEEVQEDTWGGHSPPTKSSTEKPTEPSTIGSPQKA